MEAKARAEAQKKRRVVTTTFSPGVRTISWEVGGSCPSPPCCFPASLVVDCFFSLVEEDEARRAMDRGFVFTFVLFRTS